MIDYFANFDAEARLYGYHRGGNRPRERPHPYDEKRELEKRPRSPHDQHKEGATDK